MRMMEPRYSEHVGLLFIIFLSNFTVEEEAVCVFLQSLQALDSLNAPGKAVASEADTKHSNVENILRLCEKPGIKTNHNISACWAECRSSKAGTVWLLTNRGPKLQKPFAYLSVYL